MTYYRPFPQLGKSKLGSKNIVVPKKMTYIHNHFLINNCFRDENFSQHLFNVGYVEKGIWLGIWFSLPVKFMSKTTTHHVNLKNKQKTQGVVDYILSFKHVIVLSTWKENITKINLKI